jgi:poly(A) polymerase
MKLEYVDSLTLAHPFTKGFEQVSHCISDDEVRAVAQGENWESISKRKKEDMEGKDGASTVHSTSFYIGLAIAPKNCMSIASVLSCVPIDILAPRRMKLPISGLGD